MLGHREAVQRMPVQVVEKIAFFMQVENEKPVKLLVPAGYVFSQYCDLACNVYLTLSKPANPVYLEPVQVTRFNKDNAILVKFRVQGGDKEYPPTVKEAIDVHFNAEPHWSDADIGYASAPEGRFEFSFSNMPIPTRCTPNKLIEILTTPATASPYAINVFLLCYPKFFRPEQLLEKVLQRFGTRTPSGQQLCEKLVYISQVRQATRLQSMHFIIRWLRSYPEDFTILMAKKVAVLAASLTSIGFRDLAEEVQSTLQTLGYKEETDGDLDMPAFEPRKTVQSLSELSVFPQEISGSETYGNPIAYAYRCDSCGITGAPGYKGQSHNSLSVSGPCIPAMALFGYQTDIPVETKENECLALHSPFSLYNNPSSVAPTQDVFLTEPRPLCPMIEPQTKSTTPLPPTPTAGTEGLSFAPSVNIMGLAPDVLASHIGYIMYEAYMHVHPREMPGQRQTKLTRQPQIRQEIPNLALLIDRHNNLSSWVTMRILESASDYPRRLELFIKTAYELYRTHQYESAISVYSAATSTAVTRIALYKTTISGNSGLESIAKELNEFIDVSGNMANYKRAWEELGCAEFCAPYVGATLRQITLIEDTMGSSDGCFINFGRMCHLYNCTYYFLRHQLGPQMKFNVRQDIVDELVKAMVNIDPDEMWNSSYRLQPRA